MNNLEQVERHSTPSEVRVVDLNMPFLSMVVFMVKWAIAAIPAVIILLLVFTIVGTLFGRALFP
jgi:hypothetical protein